MKFYKLLIWAILFIYIIVESEGKSAKPKTKRSLDWSKFESSPLGKIVNLYRSMHRDTSMSLADFDILEPPLVLHDQRPRTTWNSFIYDDGKKKIVRS